MKYHGFNTYDFALVPVRIIFSFRLIYGTVDNIISWERMLEFKLFLESNHFPLPLLCAVISVYMQFLAGISWILGYKMKLFSLLMIGNFLLAIYVHLAAGDAYLTLAPALHLLAISILFYVIGPGKISITEFVKYKPWNP